ncbi:uncharacterized protein LOC142978600 [Anticarsia gemmatalis]|uniref:uncharacterized protein LOC142978600 n=1 Tax=Anticarsia gemmatalis TaxID=129554 RepID=UPI003F759BE8
MLTTVISLAMHITISSLQGIRAVGQAVGYVIRSNMSSGKTKINFNPKHLSKGDPLPPYNGKLRLYNMRYCPFAQRAVLALNAKNIDYEIVNIDLVDKPEWLAQKSAFTKVPALEVAEGVSIYESLVIVEYLDDVYPERPLFPKDPVKKAFDKILVEALGQIHNVVYRTVKAPETITDELIVSYHKALAFIQSTIEERGTKYLDGEQPGYADYMLWPWFERIPSFPNDKIQIEESKYPILSKYIKDMWEDPVVKEYALPKELFQRFHSAFANGTKPEYDMLLQESCSKEMSSPRVKINFNTKHLKKGDPLPPYNGKLRLYSTRYCPFAQRAVLTLNAKNLDYEVVNIDLVDKPEWFITKSKFSKVPALEIADGMCIYESLVIVQYLDDVYPERQLFPKDPVTKAFDQIIVEACGPIYVLVYKLMKMPVTASEDDIAAYFKALAFLEEQLEERGTKFLDGEQPGYADYTIWPWFERIPSFEDKRTNVDDTKYKLLAQYLNNMMQDPVVKEYLIPKKTYQEFHSAFAQNKKPDFDLLLQE